VANVVIVSFRLGGTDGVAIEAAKWTSALRALGHEVRLIAGEGPVDVRVPELAIDAPARVDRRVLGDAFAGADLVIVENMASLPLNLDARDALYDVLRDRVAIFHHHDFAWQRERLAHLEGPRDNPLWRHVTINELSRRQLAERGIDSVTIMNSFDCDPPVGRRLATRTVLGLDDEILALLPTRAIARKNIEGALTLCAAVGATAWLLGPSEEGFEDSLAQLLARSGVTVRRGLNPGSNVHDAYAACDLVVMASTWEGFGNPVLESVTHRRPLALYPYPVAREIEGFGFTFFHLEDVAAIRSFLEKPDSRILDENLVLARRHFNVANLAARLERLLQDAGVGD